MTVETPSSASSDNREDEQHTCYTLRGRRVEDELRLRELELQTNFQIQTLTESLNLLKSDFHSWRDSLNEKLQENREELNKLSTRMTVAVVLLLGQLAGGTALIGKFLGL